MPLSNTSVAAGTAVKSVHTCVLVMGTGSTFVTVNFQNSFVTSKCQLRVISSTGDSSGVSVYLSSATAVSAIRQTIGQEIKILVEVTEFY